ncbi:UB2J2 enzyme, partial [Polyodon spathula]|nr:UB2J2 enzyme [Polyodon spathula]
MSNNSNKRAPTTATQRLKQDYLRIKKDPVPYICAEPLPSNILEWHYVVRGPEKTPYEGGYYHGKLIFPREFPFKPPSIYMITPNGRFKCNTRLCLSITDFHPDTWNPAWSVSTILTGLLSFMVEKGPTLGSIETSDFTKRQLAAQSLAFNAKDKVFCDLFPEVVENRFASWLCKVASLRWEFRWLWCSCGLWRQNQQGQFLLNALQRTLLARHPVISEVDTCRAGLCPPEAGSSETSAREFLGVKEEAGLEIKNKQKAQEELNNRAQALPLPDVVPDGEVHNGHNGLPLLNGHAALAGANQQGLQQANRNHGLLGGALANLFVIVGFAAFAYTVKYVLRSIAQE